MAATCGPLRPWRAVEMPPINPRNRSWLLILEKSEPMSRTLARALVVSAALAAPATAEVRLEGTFPTGTSTEAPALVLGGTFVILATVNGAAHVALRVDSGATDVMLPRTVAARLISAGLLAPHRLLDHQDLSVGRWLAPLLKKSTDCAH